MSRKAFCQALNVLSTGAHCAWSKRVCGCGKLLLALSCTWKAAGAKAGSYLSLKSYSMLQHAVACTTSTAGLLETEAVAKTAPAFWPCTSSISLDSLHLARIPRVSRVRFCIDLYDISGIPPLLHVTTTWNHLGMPAHVLTDHFASSMPPVSVLELSSPFDLEVQALLFSKLWRTVAVTLSLCYIKYCIHIIVLLSQHVTTCHNMSQNMSQHVTTCYNMLQLYCTLLFLFAFALIVA